MPDSLMTYQPSFEKKNTFNACESHDRLLLVGVISWWCQECARHQDQPDIGNEFSLIYVGERELGAKIGANIGPMSTVLQRSYNCFKSAVCLFFSFKRWFLVRKQPWARAIAVSLAFSSCNGETWAAFTMDSFRHSVYPCHINKVRPRRAEKPSVPEKCMGIMTPNE